jgi:hypothetical protein
VVPAHSRSMDSSVSASKREQVPTGSLQLLNAGRWLRLSERGILGYPNINLFSKRTQRNYELS